MARCFLVACCVARCLDTFRYGNWNLPNVCSLILLISIAFFFLEETGFARDKESEPLPLRPSSFWSYRISTFFPGTAVVTRTTVAHIVGLLAIFLSCIVVDDLGHSLYYAIQDWDIAGDHDRWFLRYLHLWFRCRLRNHSLNFPADTRKRRRLRLHDEAERRM